MITEEEFKKATGWKPKDCDMERVNCDKVGEFGHQLCGWCDKHDLPRFSCGCRKTPIVSYEEIDSGEVNYEISEMTFNEKLNMILKRKTIKSVSLREAGNSFLIFSFTDNSSIKIKCNNISSIEIIKMTTDQLSKMMIL